MIKVLKDRQQLESKWLKNLLANRTKYGERCFPALASSREPHWCLDKQGKALYTDLDISPVKSYLQWRTLIEILKEACWGKVGVDWKHSTGFENKKSSPRFTFSKHHWRMWKKTQAINSHSQRTFQATTLIILISPVVHCTPISTSPNIWMMLSMFSAVLQSSTFCAPGLQVQQRPWQGANQLSLTKTVTLYCSYFFKVWSKA